MEKSPDSSPGAYEQVMAERSRIVEAMQRNHPGHRLQDIGEIGYRSSRLSPRELIAAGGFVPVKKHITLGTALHSPNNEGLVDFSFIPEVTTIFTLHENKQEHYIYAAPLDKGYLMPGDWRQAAVPALPLPQFVVARKILSGDGRHALLAEPVIIGNLPEAAKKDETFQRFLQARKLDIPQDIGLGDEHSPPHYSIKDTPVSSRLFPSR